MKKVNLFLMIATSVFCIAVISTYVAKAATTWQGPPSNCTSPSQPGCNVDGVIWNTDQPQDARFNITGKGVVGGLEVSNNAIEVKNGADTNFSINTAGQAGNNFIWMTPTGDLNMSNGKALRADAAGASSLLNIGNFSPTGKYVDVAVYGNLKLHPTPANLTPSICFDDGDPASCRTSWPSGGGFTQADADLLYVKKGGDVMTGVLSNNVGFQATNYVSSPNIYLGTLGVNPYSELHNSWWRLSSDSGKIDFQPNILGMVGKTWTGNRPFTLSMRSVGDYNKQTGWIGMGDPDNVGDFIRYGTGKTAEVVLLSSVSAGDDYASMVGVISNLTNAAGQTAGMFKYSDDSKRVELVNQTYAMNVKGDANFQNQICLGGVCKNAWPAGIVTGQTVGGGLQLNAGNTLGIQNCPAGNVMKSTGISTWGCSTDQNSGGTITGVTAGTALTGGGASGAVTLNLDTTVTDARYLLLSGGTVSGNISFGTTVRQMLNLWSTQYGIGVQADTLYYRSNNNFAWYKGGVHNDATFNAGGGTALMKLDGTGNLQIGTGTTGCLKDGDGTIISGTCASDQRLKKDIKPLSNILNKFVQLKPVNFVWKADGKSDIGLIAQEVEKIFPYLVEKNEEGYKSVSYNVNLLMLTIQSVKELKAENDALQAKNAELERRLEVLEKKLR